jgi:hypothetical protein
VHDQFHHVVEADIGHTARISHADDADYRRG